MPCGTCRTAEYLMFKTDGEEASNPSERMISIANGDAFENTEDEYKEVVRYEEEKVLYNILKLETELRTDNNVLCDFYDEKKEEVIGKMKEVKDAIKELSNKRIVRDSILTTEQLSEIEIKQDAVNASRVFEVNEKRVAEIYIQAVAAPLKKNIDLGNKTNRLLLKLSRNNTLNDSTASQSYINWLAHQCPLIQGHSVYEARALYALVNPNEMYDDEQLCRGSYKKEKIEANKAAEEINLDISLRPNPANNYITLSYNLSENQVGILIITNELGAVVYRSNLPGSQYSFTVNTTQFANGVYNYNFIADGKPIKRDKFVVIK